MASCVKEGNLFLAQHPLLGQIRGLDPWAVENGIHIIRAEADGAQGIMLVTPHNTQQYGTVHGGILVAFADTVAGTSMVAQGKVCVTQSSTVNFLRPAAGAYLLCTATPVKVGRHIGVVSVETRNDQGDLVTTALFTFAVVQETDPILLPPKHPHWEGRT